MAKHLETQINDLTIKVCRAKDILNKDDKVLMNHELEK
jgi:hypothetical protein